VNSGGVRHHQGELLTAAGLVLEDEVLPYTQDRNHKPSSEVSKLLSLSVKKAGPIHQANKCPASFDLAVVAPAPSWDAHTEQVDHVPVIVFYHPLLCRVDPEHRIGKRPIGIPSKQFVIL